MRSSSVPSLFGVLVLAVMACNLGSGPRASQADLPATITSQALALQAPALSSTSPAGFVSSAVEVSVTSDTNCRTGPSKEYDLVFVAKPGLSFRVVGRYTTSDYWIIANPAGGTCWLWGQYALLSGDASGLPEYPAPATSTPKATKTPKPTATTTATTDPRTLLPNAPVDLKGSNYSCQLYFEGINPKWRERLKLTWTDSSDNEEGFRIYQNNVLVNTGPKDTYFYSLELTWSLATSHSMVDTWGVEAYNAAGSSARVELTVPTCNQPTPSS